MSQTNSNWEQLDIARSHILFCIKAFFIIFLCLYPFNQDLYRLLANPLQLNQKYAIIATKVVSPFTTPIKLCLVTSFVISMPIILWQLWLFLKPAMKKNEKRTLAYLLIFGCSLFIFGIYFCISYVLPNTIKVFQNLTPSNVIYMPDMDAYLDFALSLLIIFGICFEVPVILITLIKFGIISINQLKSKRREVILTCFVLGMLFTPPDVISQIMLAIPMWSLFEISLLLARII